VDVCQCVSKGVMTFTKCIHHFFLRLLVFLHALNNPIQQGVCPACPAFLFSRLKPSAFKQLAHLQFTFAGEQPSVSF
jgi:hypothetical protein